MEIMYWLIPVAIFILAIAIAAFIWAVKSDQYSDLESPAYKILFDDDSDPMSEQKNNVSEKNARTVHPSAAATPEDVSSQDAESSNDSGTPPKY
ncbi:cbb3-type cytochrome oxidase assembly protein CcoS [Pleionea litopenaei]|uniref:Cbb3-type cytochrome oxidase assembly protein CcoS n=1 Tax=Pleionea litopenaei TaxID=3070815 RepID=A0AA51X6S6_9GAMM|nr:cbb3-type cytochrome oxidase assembly protein CcoS [Pleionea sp. HL-JVS1]WMS87146.1 cbb3-type cytochrome oxidase assembly protein CcoS [Pleionea sp. HL-JVS1]